MLQMLLERRGASPRPWRIASSRHPRFRAIALPALFLIVLASAGFTRTMTADGAGREQALQALSAGGHVLLLRHSSTVGRDDDLVVPADCATQRNLSDPGRDEARRVGELLREHGVRLSKVVSSQYCRCKETAAIVGGGAFETQPYLNERKMHVTLVEQLIGNFEKDERLLRPARDMIASWHGAGTMLT